MKHYAIEYYENGVYEAPKTECVLAENKVDAYKRFTEKHNVYSAWVSSVTYQNGNVKRFNTFSGKPY